MALTTLTFGPFTKGVVDSGNASVDLTGAARSLRNVVYSGAMLLQTRPGTVVALTLYDDAGTPAPITNVIAIQAFADGALAIGYSSATHKCYLYKLTAALDGWYDSSGVLQSTLTPHPQGVLWSTMTVVPDVVIAEGLGIGYIAHTAPADTTGLFWATRTYDNGSRAIADLTADLDGSGAHPVYFATVKSFQQHLWGAGFGSGVNAATGYRPELARFSQPNFGAFQASDSITLGDRVRSDRERILGLGAAEDALFLGAPYMLTRVTGFGRSSWFRKPLDRSHGFVGPKCMVADGSTLYYWSSRGPMRVSGNSAPEPLWDGINALVRQVVNPATIVATRDEARDLVIFTVDIGSGVRTWCGYDVRRDLWVGPDNDWGLAIRCGGEVDPITLSTATPPGGTYPIGGAPTAPVTSDVGATSATAAWTAADPTAPTNVYLKQMSVGITSLVTTLPAGSASYIFTGLSASSDYQWAVAHVKGGQESPLLGPSPATEFVTAAAGTALLPPSGLHVQGGVHGLRVWWTNSGESGVSTSVELAGPTTLTPTPSDFSESVVVAPGLSSTTITVPEDGTWWARIRHVKSGFTSSDFVGPLGDFAPEST